MAWGALRYLYVGTADTGRDVDWYVKKAGARQLWRFQAFGADVAGLELAAGPTVILADHRPAASVLPIWEVDDLKATVKAMMAAGWKPEGPPFEVPTGPCRIFKDPSGTQLCLTQTTRPGWPGEGEERT